jgi:hypothetical protein
LFTGKILSHEKRFPNNRRPVTARRHNGRPPSTMRRYPMPGLEGKVALVTGAGGMRGVGRATALKLAGLGADIALTDVHRER